MRGWITLAVLSLGPGNVCAITVHADVTRDSAQVEKGTVHFQPCGDQSNIPERYRLVAHTFTYEMSKKADLPNSKVEVYQVRFPSPVVSPHPENNTVHAEYYRPQGRGPFPAVVVLDITAGNQKLSRSIATHLAQYQIAGLFVQMAYYGPRRPPGSKHRLLSPSYKRSMEAIRQTVLDIRQATAWLESRPEVNPQRLGVLGTSLGSFMGALAAEMEPKLKRVAILLGGGGVVDAYYDHPQAARYRKIWEALGGTKAKLAALIAPADPLTCAANLKDRKVLMIAAKRDAIVPPKMAVALWKAAGEPKMVWYDCTHYGAVFYFVPILHQVIHHFGSE